MDTTQLLQQYPLRRIKPVDGMVVTADVWEEAHDYHWRAQRIIARLGYGAGILSGLDVIASDPPDNVVYVLPGIAIDSAGQLIVVQQPVAYDVGGAQGRLRLLISAGESTPRADSQQASEQNVLHVTSEFAVEIATAAPTTPAVELAQVLRQGKGVSISNAKDPLRPGPNEIDARHRVITGAAARSALRIGVVNLGGVDPACHRGIEAVARSFARDSGLQVSVDVNLPLGGLDVYHVLFLLAHRAFKAGPEDMQVIYDFVKRGGTLVAESNRRVPADAAAADAALNDLFSSLGIAVAALTPAQPLLVEPHVFAAAPAGFDAEPAGVRAGDGVIASSAGYSLVWQGERRGSAATREDIRAAHEFGANMLSYAAGRMTQATG